MGKKYVIDETTLTNIADAIREVEQDSMLKIDPVDMPGRIGNVCNKAYNDGKSDGEIEGYNKGNVAMWDFLTNKGKRTNGERVFSESNFTDIETLPYVFKPTANISCIFYNYKGDKLPRPQYVDLSKILRYENTTYGLCAWWSCSGTPSGIMNAVFPDYGIPAIDSYSFCFAYSTAIGTIEIIRCNKNTKFDNAFLGTSQLKEIKFEGVIGQNLDMSDCSKLSHDSLLNIIECLKDYSTDTSGRVYALTLGSTNQAKLSADELKQVDDKGWVVK